MDRIVEEKPKDSRTPTQVDRDRLLYATSFGRLAEVTQTVSADHGHVFHNRLTHSLKVAQLARRLAEYISTEQRENVVKAGGLDPDAAEAAGLAHDLGHPPFGHIAEDELNDIIRERTSHKDGYEGNAQSFRIVSKLATGDPVAADSKNRILVGLNLTKRTLNGILKYPWMIDTHPIKEKNSKWGAYKSEDKLFSSVRAEFEAKFGKRTKSLEAEVMDWSDDITYAVHDVLDFYCAGSVPLERFGELHADTLKSFYEEVFDRNKHLQSDADNLKAAFEDACYFYFRPIKVRYDGSMDLRRKLWLMMTSMISEYVEAIKVLPEVMNEKLVKIEVTKERQITMLKQLTWHYVIRNAEMANHQHGQQHAVRCVYEKLEKAIEKSDLRVFPPFYRQMLSESPGQEYRVIADYISGMTEKELIIVYKKLHGIEHGRMI